MATTLFRPKAYPVRKATDTSKRNGSINNPPRHPDIGGSNNSSDGPCDRTLMLSLPGGTRG